MLMEGSSILKVACQTEYYLDIKNLMRTAVRCTKMLCFPLSEGKVLQTGLKILIPYECGDK